MTLANLDLRDSLRQQAIRDPLTGLYNRRYLLETMEHEISRSSRKKSEMGLMMIDLDYFKKFNDTYGHDIGDFILAEFGRLIQLIIREEDIACRYGGEEFTLMLPETGKNDTLKVAEKIRNHIQAHKFYFNNKSYAPITLSIGIAVFPHDGKTTSTLLKQADEALYQAKDQGRNQVVTLLTS
ncbi:MAG: GGDEF domain-containing protein [Desulfobacterales bacterium]|nr:GGDEF domain-containing protein [Desulfobacterales bacterium]